MRQNVIERLVEIQTFSFKKMDGIGYLAYYVTVNIDRRICNSATHIISSMVIWS